MALKTLNPTISFDDIYTRLLFTAVALEQAAADDGKEVAALALPLNKILTRWEELDRERQTQQRAVVRANALCKRGNQRLDAALTAVHHATLAEVEMNRQAPLFTHLFPKPLSELVRPALDGQLKVSEAFVERFKLAEVPAALRKAHEPPLKDSLTSGTAAQKQRVATLAAGTALTTRIDALWEDANAALQQVEGALKQLAGKQRLSKDWIDSFFPDAPVVSSKKAVADGAAPTDAAPAP